MRMWCHAQVQWQAVRCDADDDFANAVNVCAVLVIIQFKGCGQPHDGRCQAPVDLGSPIARGQADFAGRAAGRFVV